MRQLQALGGLLSHYASTGNQHLPDVFLPARLACTRQRLLTVIDLVPQGRGRLEACPLSLMRQKRPTRCIAPVRRGRGRWLRRSTAWRMCRPCCASVGSTPLRRCAACDCGKVGTVHVLLSRRIDDMHKVDHSSVRVGPSTYVRQVRAESAGNAAGADSAAAAGRTLLAARCRRGSGRRLRHRDPSPPRPLHRAWLLKSMQTLPSPSSAGRTGTKV